MRFPTKEHGRYDSEKALDDAACGVNSCRLFHLLAVTSSDATL